MQTQTYECKDYKCRLYMSNIDILLLDIFINNKEKYKISMSYIDNIITYYAYKIIYNYIEDSNDHWKFGWHQIQEEEQIYTIKINLNELYSILKNYNIYNGDCKQNLISITLIDKDLLKQFTPQIDENQILKTIKYIL